MGSVYEVEDPGLERRLALKLLPRARAEGKAAERFLREAQALARVRHPNVIVVHETGEDPAGLYFVMDLVPGRDVLDLATSGRVLERDAVELTLGVCAGLDAIHRAGLLHRDVKPENVVLRADRGTPVLLDLGLVLDAESERLTKTGQLVGTPYAMSPEQAAGMRELTKASDVYGVGVILFVLLSGRVPFESDGGDLFGLLTRVCREEPDWPQASPAALAILRRAMAKEPGERYPDAAALAEDLERCLRGERIAGQSRGARSLWVALALGGGLALLAAGLAWRAPRASLEAPPASVTPSAAQPKPSASARPDPVQALQRVRAVSGPAGQRLAAEWLAAYPTHPLAREVRDLYLTRGLREPLSSVPLADAQWNRVVAHGARIMIPARSGLYELADPPKQLFPLPLERGVSSQGWLVVVPQRATGEPRPLVLLGPEDERAVPRIPSRTITAMVAAEGKLWIGYGDGGLEGYAFNALRNQGSPEPSVDLGRPFGSPVCDLTYDPHSRLLLAGCGDIVMQDQDAPDRRVAAWSLADPIPRKHFDLALPGSCGQIAVHPERDLIAVAVLWVQEIWILDAQGERLRSLTGHRASTGTGQILLGSSAATAHSNQIRALEFLSSGQLLSLSGKGLAGDSEFRAWDVESGAEVARRLGEPGVLYSLAVLEAGRVYTTRWQGETAPILIEGWGLQAR